MSVTVVKTTQQNMQTNVQKIDNFSARLAAVWGLGAGAAVSLCVATFAMISLHASREATMAVLGLLTGMLGAGGWEYTAYVREHILCKNAWDFLGLVFCSVIVGVLLPLITVLGFAVIFVTANRLSDEHRRAQSLLARRERYASYFVPASLMFR